MNITRKIFNKLDFFWHTRSSHSYVKWLRSKGVKIGDGCFCKFPKTITVDVSRASLIEIGNNVFIHSGTVIMAHDWTSWVFKNLYNDFIPSHGPIKIGNNVWFGQSCAILKGATIGDNCIIGYGSVVTKDIPSNSVAVGIPAKVVCTIDEYYEKRKQQYKQEVIDFAKSIRKRFNREPVEADFCDDYPAFVSKNNFEQYKNSFPYKNVFDDYQLEQWLQKHTSPFGSFKELLDKAK
jgi:acetyltransferase-like isoleucine patch superfamily enzyme